MVYLNLPWRKIKIKIGQKWAESPLPWFGSRQTTFNHWESWRFSDGSKNEPHDCHFMLLFAWKWLKWKSKLTPAWPYQFKDGSKPTFWPIESFKITIQRSRSNGKRGSVMVNGEFNVWWLTTVKDGSAWKSSKRDKNDFRA